MIVVLRDRSFSLLLCFIEIPVKAEPAPLKMAIRAANYGSVLNNQLFIWSLCKCMKILKDLQSWTPIPPTFASPPLQCYVLVFDAAGFSLDDQFEVGVGGVAYLGDTTKIVGFQHISWPDCFILKIDKACAFCFPKRPFQT